MPTSVAEAAQKRTAAAEKSGQAVAVRAVPDGVAQRRTAPAPAQMRAGTTTKDGKDFLTLDGMASVYERDYEMWDWAGPYDEVVSEGAGSISLAKDPDVVFLLNHTGIPFARTKSGTLDLSEPGGGLQSVGYLNPQRQDASDLVASVADGSTTEMSFAFRIMDGRWSPDYTQYRIAEYDLDRGDTSVVTFGANPYTSVEARAAHFQLRADVMRAVRILDEGERDMLRERLGAVPEDAVQVEPAKLGARAIQDLRLLRASVEQDGLDQVARFTLVAVLDDLIEGTGYLAGGDGALPVLLNLRADTPAPVPVPRALSLSLVEHELAAARKF